MRDLLWNHQKYTLVGIDNMRMMMRLEKSTDSLCMLHKQACVRDAHNNEQVYLYSSNTSRPVSDLIPISDRITHLLMYDMMSHKP